MYRGAVCPGEIARLCCGAGQMLCPQVVLRRRCRFRCSLCGKWMASCGARHERGTGRITDMVDRQPCAWRDYRVVLRLRDRFRALSWASGPADALLLRSMVRRLPSGTRRKTRTMYRVAACRGEMQGCVATQSRCRAHRPRVSPSAHDVPGSRVSGRGCKVVLRCRAGFAPSGLRITPSTPCVSNG